MAFIIFDKVYKPKDYKKAIKTAFNNLGDSFSNDFRSKNIEFNENELGIKSENGKDYVKILTYDENGSNINLHISYKTARYFNYDINPKDDNKSKKIQNLVLSIYNYLKEQHSQKIFLFEEPIRKGNKKDIYILNIKVKEKQTPEIFRDTIYELGRDIIEVLQNKKIKI